MPVLHRAPRPTAARRSFSVDGELVFAIPPRPSRPDERKDARALSALNLGGDERPMVEAAYTEQLGRAHALAAVLVAVTDHQSLVAASTEDERQLVPPLGLPEPKRRTFNPNSPNVATRSHHRSGPLSR